MYKLDTKAARNADSGGTMIKEVGKYVGEFTQAKKLTAKSGAMGIEFAFKSKSGQKANLSIYTQSAAGQPYQGYDTLMAIMTCMSLRSINAVLGVATKYDFDSRQDVEEECEIFPDLCKPIGVLLETEDYAKNNGTIATKIVLKNVFRIADKDGNEFTASEILDHKKEAKMLDRLVAQLKHKPLKTIDQVPAPTQQSYSNAAPEPAHTSTFDDSDDIPFATSSMYYDMTTSKQRRMAKYSY